MIRAFFYLTLCSWRNLLLVQLKRMKQPKYLIGVVAGSLYFILALFGPLLMNRDAMGRSAHALWQSVQRTEGGQMCIRLAVTTLIPR